MRLSWLWAVGFSSFFSIGCGDGAEAPAYAARVEAAQARVTQATCACLWTEQLRQECERYAGSALDDACSPDSAAELAREHPSYAECLAQTTERTARCLEEASCQRKPSECAHDAHAECGPVPKDMPAALVPCLPHYRCKTGQEVTLDRRCNGERDCFDGSDEQSCD